VQTSSLFKVYNASAGSGKTFTLVKEYLKIILSTPNAFTFKKILAITFTNKAANEMKERILNNLRSFSDADFNTMAEELCTEIPLDKAKLQLRASGILREIINNYTAFAITTIDSFTYKIIRSFAFDLGLSPHFEVELNSKSILDEAVAILISKIGQDDELTKTLLLFALFKWQKDESWDVSFALRNIANLLIDESALTQLDKLKDKTLSDYLGLHKKLKQQIDAFDAKIDHFSKEGQTLLQQISVPKNAFAGGGDYPGFIKKLSNKNYKDLNFEGRLGKSILNENWSSAKATTAEALAIEKHSEALKDFYLRVESHFKKKHPSFVLAQLALKNIIPLSVLSSLNTCLTDYKTDNNIRLNSEFNNLIRKHIKDEPVPFIYEKIGEKYSHFFIDEMQDTSVFQWENLIPLIGNALSQANSSLFLVGDAKQAIYRWRGGEAQQFIDLTLNKNPFFTKKQVETLPTNYRSFSKIVNFNNDFFKNASKFLSNPTYHALYKDNNNQNITDKVGGYVQIDFLEKGLKGEDKLLAYANTITIILQNLDSAYALGDVCILVRNKKDGAKIAENLTVKGFEIMTSESLLLTSATNVYFIVDFLNFLVDNSNQKALADALIFLHEHLKITTDTHSFIKPFINIPQKEFLNKLAKLSIDFSLNRFNEMALYESVTYLVRCFNLIDKSDAFIQFFLEEVLNFEQKQQGTLADFLDYFESNKDSFSVISSQNTKAVSILTIHKAKGLEFPIVIFPNNVSLYKEINPTEWYNPDKPSDFNNFDTLLINGGPQLEKTDTVGQTIYKNRKEALELDNLNLLYVGLTRAVEQLYIVTEPPPSKKTKSITYSLIFEDFLKAEAKWQEGQNTYTFGSKERPKQKGLNKTIPVDTLAIEHISTDWQSHNIHIVPQASKYWHKPQKEAADFGTLLHDILAHIKTKDDINTVLNRYYKLGQITQDDISKYKNLLLSVVKHPQLKEYYAVNTTAYNECEIVTASKELIRLDRLILKDKTAVIIDYKTGAPNTQHQTQINDYAKAVSDMSYTITDKILVYIQEPVEVIFV
jgi:ATP-dependent exoDNAse (exonuclease V) beta subunit